MEAEKFLEIIKNIIKENEDLEPRIKLQNITLNTSLGNDLGFDSLGVMSVVYELQEIFPDLDENLMNDWKTIKDIFDSV